MKHLLDMKAKTAMKLVAALCFGGMTIIWLLLACEAQAQKAPASRYQPECRNVSVPHDKDVQVVAHAYAGLWACWRVGTHDAQMVCARLTEGDPLWCNP